MLNKLFSQLCDLDGVSHVCLMDQFGTVLQTTTKWPDSAAEQRTEWSEYCSFADQLELGPLYEAWSEGRRLTLYDHCDNKLFVHISGRDGRKGVWRYELERLRQEWNSKQPEVL